MIEIQNITNENVQVHTVELEPEQKVEVDYTWASVDQVLQYIVEEKIQVILNNVEIESFADQLSALSGNAPQIVKIPENFPSVNTPFASKSLQDGSRLFRRLHGEEYTLDQGENTLEFEIPYPHAKMTGLEIVNSEALDRCDFTVHDSENGAYSGESFRKLNQFGFGVIIKEGSHVHVCKYDADLYLGMLVRISYHSKSAKTIGINCYLDEVKS